MSWSMFDILHKNRGFITDENIYKDIKLKPQMQRTGVLIQVQKS